MAPPDSHRILELANGVAHRRCMNTRWSTWHAWDFYHNNLSQGGTCCLPEEVWEMTKPYGSCVDMSLQNTQALRSLLEQDPQLKAYASNVRTLARTSSENPKLYSHCLTAFCHEDFCIVIDRSFTFNAVKIDVNSHADSLSYASLEGDSLQICFHYIPSTDVSNESYPGRALTYEYPRRDSRPTFVPIADDEAIMKISIPLAQDTTRVEGTNFRVPTSKSIKIYEWYDEKPPQLPSALLGGKYFATVCKIKVDFALRMVVVQIPYQDWLLKEENEDLHRQLQDVGLVIKFTKRRKLPYLLQLVMNLTKNSKNPSRLMQLIKNWNSYHRKEKMGLLTRRASTVANLVLLLGAGRDGGQDFPEKLSVVGNVVERIGMGMEKFTAQDFGRVVDSVYDVWEPFGGLDQKVPEDV